MEKVVFIEGHIEEEKVFDGAVLPKTLLRRAAMDESKSSNNVDELVMGIEQNKDWLCSTLKQHGAVLFRGFNVVTDLDFLRVVEAFGWEEMPYFGASPRTKICHRIYTANESPLHLLIDFHHEMSLMRKYPSKVFMCCITPSPEGGPTCLARSNVLLREMERRVPEFVQKVERVGFFVDMEFPKDDTDQLVFGRAWKIVLGTDDPVEAERRAKEKMDCSSFEIIEEDGSAKITFGPSQVVRTLQGERLWFNNIRVDEAHKKRLGDGSPILIEAINAYTQALNEIEVNLRWQRGDVLLVDNWSTQHARKPGKPPRQILLSMCK